MQVLTVHVYSSTGRQLELRAYMVLLHGPGLVIARANIIINNKKGEDFDHLLDMVGQVGQAVNLIMYITRLVNIRWLQMIKSWTSSNLATPNEAWVTTFQESRLELTAGP